jgi:membrane-bound lytic murein transglycosylase D
MVLRLALFAWCLQVAPVAAAATGADGASADVPRREGGRKGAARPESEVAPEAAPAEVPAEVPEEVMEGIWDWLERLDGEVVPEAAADEVNTDVEARIAEQAFTRTDGGVDVPKDYYEDPLRALQGDPLFLDRINPADFDIPIAINDEVISRLRLFLGPHRKYIQTWLERKARYEPMILAELEKAGLPKDIIYLSMIESGFNPYAYSSAAAAGLWQFIPATGQHYGLDVDWWVDERRDPEMSTKSAVKFLGELHKMLGDWHLAFAAYNTGPGRVKRLVEASKAAGRPATYWDLLERRELHPETAGYVPKIIAAAIIGHYPERYGFTGLNPQAPLEYDAVTVSGAIDLEVLARCAGLNDEEFRLLNPIFRRYATPDGTSHLRLPKGTASKFEEALAKVPPEERLQLVKHMVRRGETLSIIAGRYGVSSSEIARVNGLNNPNQIEVGQWLVVPLRGGLEAPPVTAVTETRASASSASAAADKPVATSSSSASTTTHKVRSGETLALIAGRYGVKSSDLARWNDISDPTHIEVGQVLQIKGSTSAAAAPAAAPAAQPTKKTYTVRSGDTLSEIASRYGVGLSELQRWNRISGTRIYVGQKLTIYGAPASSGSSSSSSSSSSAAAAPSKPSTYTVRSGDTLSEIATRYGLSVSDLQSWNGIRNASDVKVGQVLQLKKPASSSSSSSSSSAPTATWITHTVRSGESLGLIAERYGVSVSDLRSWNKISGSTIYAGQKLKVKKGG